MLLIAQYAHETPVKSFNQKFAQSDFHCLVKKLGYLSLANLNINYKFQFLYHEFFIKLSISLSISGYPCLSLYTFVYPCYFSWLSLSIPVFLLVYPYFSPCRSLSFLVYHCLPLSILIYPCLSLSIFVYPYFSRLFQSIIVYPCLFPCLSLYILVYPYFFPCLSLSILFFLLV